MTTATATKAEPRFFRIRIKDDTIPDPAYRCQELVVDRWSRDEVHAPKVGYHAIHWRAYSRPSFSRWAAGSPMTIALDPEWLCGLYRVEGSVKPGDTIDEGQWDLTGHLTAASQPSLFGQICSAFGIENPAKI